MKRNLLLLKCYPCSGWSLGIGKKTVGYQSDGSGMRSMGGGNPVLFPMISNMAELSCVKLSGFIKYMVDYVLAKGFFENLEKYKFEQLYMTNVDVNAPSS